MSACPSSSATSSESLSYFSSPLWAGWCGAEVTWRVYLSNHTVQVSALSASSRGWTWRRRWGGGGSEPEGGDWICMFSIFLTDLRKDKNTSASALMCRPPRGSLLFHHHSQHTQFNTPPGRPASAAGSSSGCRTSWSKCPAPPSVHRTANGWRRSSTLWQRSVTAVWSQTAAKHTKPFGQNFNRNRKAHHT